MICHLCKQAITADQQIEFHHPVYKSKGRTTTAPTHKACHRRHHSEQGDFAAWGRLGGRLSSVTRVWSINLKNVSHMQGFVCDAHRVSNRVEKLARPIAASSA
jgi:hypothetical protein